MMRKRTGLTLIELLVVIAIIALLMAILMPTLRQAKRQAKAVACQARLRQWGQICSLYIADNDGQFFGWDEFFGPFFSLFHRDRHGNYWFGSYRRDRGEQLLCPTASKPRDWELPDPPAFLKLGDKSSAWAWFLTHPEEPWFIGSYGLNYWVLTVPASELGNNSDSASHPPVWRTCLVKGASRVPVLLDCRVPHAAPQHNNDPPEHEDRPFARSGAMWTFCSNRHDGGIHSLFMDWSVRRVGLKELWTLKWHRQYDTAGPWTRAGGVHPEDWPEWMRRFKDY
jgi:prepilin-type N-terminal cleavage/methylation domain-containing protein